MRKILTRNYVEQAASTANGELSYEKLLMATFKLHRAMEEQREQGKEEEVKSDLRMLEYDGSIS